MVECRSTSTPSSSGCPAKVVFRILVRRSGFHDGASILSVQEMSPEKRPVTPLGSESDAGVQYVLTSTPQYELVVAMQC
jgi:hypothetical protein